MASYWFNGGLEEVAKKTLDWVNDTIKVRLVTSLPARTITSMTGVTGVGSDQTLGTKSLVKDDTNHRVKFVAGSATFSALAAGSTIVGAVVYKFGTNDADSVPMAVGDIGAIPTNGGGLVFPWETMLGTANVVLALALYEATGGETPFIWDAVAGADDYRLKVGTSSGVYTTYDELVGYVLTHSLPLAAGTYYWIVQPYQSGSPYGSPTVEEVVVVT